MIIASQPDHPRSPKARLLALPATLSVTILLVLLSGPAPRPALASRPPGGHALQSAADIAGCPLLPADDIWNTPVDALPVDPASATYVATIGAGLAAKGDFGSGLWNGGPIGIPFVVVPGDQPRVPLTFRWPGESDPGPYPIPRDAPIEGGAQADPGSDRHILVVDRDHCLLYEVYQAIPRPDGGWNAGSGAIFDLRSSALRPDTWTSADAAGLPILPGLVRYDEVASGEIRHALRFTVRETRRATVWPARHFASSLVEARFPPMGQRFRLKAGVDIAGYSPEVQVILRGLKKYGMILADNGSPWFISGVPDERWNNDHIQELRRIRGSDFEAVDVTSLMVDPDSGRVRGGGTDPTATPTATSAPSVTPMPPTATPTAIADPTTRPTVSPSPSAWVVEATPTRPVDWTLARYYVPWAARNGAR